MKPVAAQIAQDAKPAKPRRVNIGSPMISSLSAGIIKARRIYHPDIRLPGIGPTRRKCEKVALLIREPHAP
jgi:hypothetical protein